MLAQKENNFSKTKRIDSLISSLNKNYNDPKKLKEILDKSSDVGYVVGMSKAHMILSFYYRKHNRVDSAFYHVNRSIKLCKENNLDKELYNSYLSLGSIYGKIKNYEKSLEVNFKAYDFYKKQDSNNHKTILRALEINIASTYSLLGDYELAHQYYIKILQDPDFDSKSIHYSQLHQNLALNLKRQKKFDDAIVWLNKGLELTNNNNHELVKNDILKSLCDVYLLQNKNKEAEKIYHLVDEDYNWNKDFYLGMIYLGLNKLQDAEILFLRSIEKEKDDRKNMDSFHKLSEVYTKQNLWKKAKVSKDKYYTIKDSLISINNKEIIKNNEIGFKLIEEELLNKQLDIENKLLIAKNKRQSNIIIGVTLLSIIGVLCFFLLIKNIRVNKELTKLKKTEKQLLEDKIQLRENELNLTIVAITNRQKMFEELKIEIDKFDKSTPQIKNLKSKLKSLMMSGDDLFAIQDRIESRYPGMITQLKKSHPQLSNTEIRYCIFTKLNLSIKETASILGVSADTVKTSRSRIKKKMNVSESLTLGAYLEEYFNAS
ncbi:LuxR C-terminal-related transcriptional regulator [uncultured Aquimarina sp.]|uniref:LuxR C-terminal-related transcriptional regulator n=1 Tax=uncultured Aquimarina sp. TaxID=575652 RepID=UPI002609832E|nr:LuxR C-terminal-related transcriptional regulator [uncultured Aquimarina sp.]